MRPGSIIDDLAEAEPGYLAKQNKELRRLLVECRKELYEVQHSAFGWRSCNVPRQEMTRKGGGGLGDEFWAQNLHALLCGVMCPCS
jgi:hypothetical protein